VIARAIHTALSLRQPWAWMVVHGGKTIENRRWNTARRGPVLIHAAKGMTRAEYDDAVDFAADVNPELVVPPRADLLFGGIVGRARIVGVHAPCTKAKPAGEAVDLFAHLFGGEECEHPWHMPAQFGFVLADVEPLRFRPWKGELGFFSVRGSESCSECAGRGWHVGECHPREECAACEGLGFAPPRSTDSISKVQP
jgi:hypothetical protein